jgi:hypothetical protein
MSCSHKFIDQLNCLNLNYKPQTLIIGTFNPEWPVDNYAKWFYGRVNNNYFWNVLPRVLGYESLRHLGPNEWKSFCSQNGIVITDLISSINDADQTNPLHNEIISKFKDTEFANTFSDFEMTNVIDILENYPSIKKIFFTRNSGVELFDNLIQGIIDFCRVNDIYFSHLITPSKNARFQMRGWNPKNPNLERDLPNFIYEKWLENWK